MRQTVTRTHTHTHEEVRAVTCDLCKATIDNYGEWPMEGGSIYVEITLDKRTYGGAEQAIEYDICPTCFTTIVQPFLESKGATPNVVDYASDWTAKIANSQNA